MSPNKSERTDPAYLRERGKREIRQQKRRKLSFSFIKLITTQGQTFEEWQELEILSTLNLRIKFLNQFSVQEALQKGYIKQYSKVEFPPNSGFTQPKHIIDVTWVVLHITNTSKEVVVGYINDDIFFIVFLDKEHQFWLTKK